MPLDSNDKAWINSALSALEARLKDRTSGLPRVIFGMDVAPGDEALGFGSAFWQTHEGVEQLLARPVADVDEEALADALLARGFGGVSNEDLARIADAVNDELSRRAAG